MAKTIIGIIILAWRFFRHSPDSVKLVVFGLILLFLWAVVDALASVFSSASGDLVRSVWEAS